MSHSLKSHDNSGGLAGVAELPQASDINGCDADQAPKTPAETPANPAECRTFRFVDPRLRIEDPPEIDRRLAEALHDAGRSPLGMPGTVDTLKAMLARAGLVLVLA